MMSQKKICDGITCIDYRFISIIDEIHNCNDCNQYSPMYNDGDYGIVNLKIISPDCYIIIHW